MALNNYSTDGWLVTLNGRILTDWGETDPPFTHDQIDAQGTLRRGQGGGACRLDRINPGESFVLNLNPGSPDSTFVQALLSQKANLTIGGSQLGTLETFLGTEGMVVGKGSTGRGGQTITDDQYTLEFNIFSETKGGN